VGALGWLVVALGGVALIVWGAETFAEHLAVASTRLGVSTFALALLLAGAEPEELATAVTASLRDAPAVAFGDVIGANVAICLVALGVGALVAPLPFGGGVMRYGLGGLAAGALAAAIAWDGTVTRAAGAVLVGAYVAFVAVIWSLERRPPELGETAELDEAAGAGPHGRVGVELLLVVAGVVAMAVGAVALVEGIRRISDLESTQTVLGLTVVGFATAFELVALAWSSARRGITPAVVAAVVGSYTYNATMTPGRPRARPAAADHRCRRPPRALAGHARQPRPRPHPRAPGPATRPSGRRGAARRLPALRRTRRRRLKQFPTTSCTPHLTQIRAALASAVSAHFGRASCLALENRGTAARASERPAGESAVLGSDPGQLLPRALLTTSPGWQFQVGSARARRCGPLTWIDPSARARLQESVPRCHCVNASDRAVTNTSDSPPGCE
jgi:cation:H+ antiporter